MVSASGKLNATNLLKSYQEGTDFGNETAQFRMGVFYNYGFFDGEKLIDIDLKRSILHYYFAALGGSSSAQTVLGFKHMHGLGKFF